MFRNPLFPLLCLLLATFVGQTQVTSEHFSFYRNQNIPVIQQDTLSLPWIGGLNSVRFFELDIDIDGNDDLLVFEKHGNRLLPFLRHNDQLNYAPQYRQNFPDIHDWMVIHDYNQDGRPDIFTYGLAGIRVFENISENQLQFRLHTEQLQAYYYNGHVNIYASPDDNLVVDDINGDGRTDILNFWVLGRFVHFLKNYSNDPNVFDLRLESECWGHFEEAADNNTITLFSDCSNKSGESQERHTGSSMLWYDFDRNGLNDILIGDVDSPNLILLHNTGTIDDARMTAQDTAFPVHAPISLLSMPAVSLLNNGSTLIASPSDPSLNKSQDHHSVWRYEYDSLLQQYTLAQTDYLQAQTIDIGSGAHPVFYDWNGDGLQDLFISNYGQFDSSEVVNGFVKSHFSSSIQYYVNVGENAHPAFALADDDFGHLREKGYVGLHPTFGDLDGDNLPDMLCGRQDGTLLWVPNQRIVSGTGDVVENYLGIDAGSFSTPTLFDLDNDMRTDLIIGNQRGLLSYWRNVGACGIANFEHITDTLGGVDVRNAEQSYFGYSVPSFYRDSHSRTYLICGCEQGNVMLFGDIDNNVSGTFTNWGILSESRDAICHDCSEPLTEGRRTGVAWADLNGDEIPDLMVGCYAGGLNYFQGREPMHITVVAQHPTPSEYQLIPNPTTGRFTITFPDSNSHTRHIQILDLCGRILQKNSEIFVDISAFPDGIYLVQVDGKVVAKVVKMGR